MSRFFKKFTLNFMFVKKRKVKKTKSPNDQLVNLESPIPFLFYILDQDFKTEFPKLIYKTDPLVSF